MQDTDEEPKTAETSEVPSPLMFQPLPLWRFCVPKPRDSGYIALWFIFWTLSLPIITNKFNADPWSWWLGGIVLTFCILSLLALGVGYLNWWLSSRHHMQQSDTLYTTKRRLEVAEKHLKETAENRREWEREKEKELQEIQAGFSGLNKELADIKKLAKPFLPKTPKN